MTRAEYHKGRFYAESLIEQAISVLDTIDGEADLDDSGDGEPSLASPVGRKAKCLTLNGRLPDIM